jgi:hypothetical protein
MPRKKQQGNLGDSGPIEVRLQPEGVSAASNRVIVFAAQAVGTTLRALETDDCTQPSSWGGQFGYQFSGLELTPEERRVEFKNWILAKGFQDLARGVREGLEEAYMLTRLIDKFVGKVTTLDQFQDLASSSKFKAGGLSFPNLMGGVSQTLNEPLTFEAEFLSLQKVRNCLEHRGGMVGEKDVDAETQRLILSFPRLKVFYLRKGQEIELFPGETIDTQEDTVFQEATEIFMKPVTQTHEYEVGHAVKIGQRDFFEIALACQMFVDDLTKKLSKSAANLTPKLE